MAGKFEADNLPAGEPEVPGPTETAATAPRPSGGPENGPGVDPARWASFGPHLDADEGSAIVDALLLHLEARVKAAGGETLDMLMVLHCLLVVFVRHAALPGCRAALWEKFLATLERSRETFADD